MSRGRESMSRIFLASLAFLWVGGSSATAAEIIRLPDFARQSEIIVLGVVCGSERIRPEPPPPWRIEPMSQCITLVVCLEVKEVLKDATGRVAVEDLLTLRYRGSCWRHMPREFVTVDSTGDSLFGAMTVVEPGGWPELGFGETVLLGLHPEGDEYAPGRGGFLLGPDSVSRVKEEIRFAEMGILRD